MFIKKFLVAATIFMSATQAASAVEFSVSGYTSNSVTFSISGQMPNFPYGEAPTFTNEIDIRYTGNLWVDGEGTYAANSLSDLPINNSGSLWFGNTGGFGLPADYSWLFFQNDLTGKSGTGAEVTLTWDGTDFLNPTGTGSFELYWSNLTEGPDPTGRNNLLLASVDVVNGVIQANDVPEPTTLALLGLGLVGLGYRRRKSGAN